MARAEAERLKAARNEKGFSQYELARVSGVGRPLIAQIETGRTSPSVRTAQRLGAALDVAWWTLYGSEVVNDG